ncbi:MAG: CHRD domain-containing protein, partial [Vicinamibacterales bacterium]
SLENGLKTRNKVESRETDAYRRALVKRGAIRAAVLATLDEHRLDALVYPTVRRKPALIGDAQLGSNCQVSATSGLPAMSVPAGFTDDGLPVGMDLLGRAYAEPRLLALAYAHEQIARPRRAPLSTPALVNGARPGAATFAAAATPEGTASPSGAAAPRATARFTFDRITGRLQYDVKTTGVEGAIVTLHRGVAGANGPVVARLLDAPTGAGEVALNAADTAALLDGALYLSVSGTAMPAVRLRGQVTAAAPRP